MFSKTCLQIIAKLLLVYIPQLDLYNILSYYDGDKLSNDIKTQAVLKSIFCTGNQCNVVRSSLGCLVFCCCCCLLFLQFSNR